MAAAAEEAKKVTLRTSDGELFEVEVATAMMAQSIKHMIEDDCANDCIPVPNVTGKILSKVLEYARKHADTAAGEEELKVWDADYIKVDMDTLYFLTLAANFLNVKGLLELCCQTVADLIKGKSVEEIRRTFNIQNDFTPQEEEEIRREHTWAFE